jgi:hypothetical protein
VPFLESSHTRKMERINGCLTYKSESGSGYQAVDPDGVVVAWSGRLLQKPAVEELIESVYKINSDIVRRRQDYRCLLCGRIGPLEIDHHPVSRARGQRNDRTDNLRAVCTVYGCGEHARKHGG